MKNKITIASLLLLLFVGSSMAAWGQPVEPAADRLSSPTPTRDSLPPIDAVIYFRIGEGRIDPEFEGNKFRLLIFVSKLEALLADPDYEVSRMVVVGTASPDGKESVNITMAGRRAQALADYLKTHTSLPADKIEVVNGGENWTGLRQMMEASDKMPYKDKMLELISIPNQRTRKLRMMYYADSKPWLWMRDHFFDQLRIGAGDTYRRVAQSKLSRENWSRMREVIHTTSFDDQTKRALLEAIDREPNAALRMSRLREVCSDAPTYALLHEQIVVGLLSEESALSADNWTLLREKVAASDLPDKTDILNIIDTTTVTRGREQALRSLNEGSAYRDILDRFLPDLLIADRGARAEHDRPAFEQTTLGAENWRCLRDMIAVSDMPGKDSVLYLIDNEPDASAREQRLRTLDNGYTYRYINEVFFPELLYGISSAAKENWEMMALAVKDSDMPHKDRILEIIQTTAPGLEREEAIRALDEGESWRRMGEMVLPELLRGTESVPLTGSGMSLYYELRAEAKARAADSLAALQVAADSLAHLTAMQDARSEDAVSGVESEAITRKVDPKRVMFALKTNLLFDVATAINLGLEVPLGGRWSLSAEAVFPQWNFDNRTSVIVTEFSIEPRLWLGNRETLRSGKQRNALTGHFVGVYGNYVDNYDLQWKQRGVMGSGYGVGLTYGYAHRLGRSFNMEYSIGVGALYLNNKSFDVSDSYDYKILRKEGSGWHFLPTRARVSLVWLIGNTRNKSK